MGGAVAVFAFVDDKAFLPANEFVTVKRSTSDLSEKELAECLAIISEPELLS